MRFDSDGQFIILPSFVRSSHFGSVNCKVCSSARVAIILDYFAILLLELFTVWMQLNEARIDGYISDIRCIALPVLQR
jgi:hypothetical protein